MNNVILNFIGMLYDAYYVNNIITICITLYRSCVGCGVMCICVHNVYMCAHVCMHECVYIIL